MATYITNIITFWMSLSNCYNVLTRFVHESPRNSFPNTSQFLITSLKVSSIAVKIPFQCYVLVCVCDFNNTGNGGPCTGYIPHAVLTYLFTNPGATLRNCSTPCWICINAPKACGFDIRLCISGFCNCCRKLGNINLICSWKIIHDPISKTCKVSINSVHTQHNPSTYIICNFSARLKWVATQSTGGLIFNLKVCKPDWKLYMFKLKNPRKPTIYC